MWTGERRVEESVASLSRFRSSIARHWLSLVLWIAVCEGLGAVYLVSIKPEFVASVQLVLQPRHIANEGPEDLRHYYQFALDYAQSETELRVLKSERVLQPVFDALHLASSPELRRGQNGFWSALASELHQLAPDAVEFDDRTRAFVAFSTRLRSRRLGVSYVIDVSYRAHNAAQAARVVNAVASSYLRGRILGAIEVVRAGQPYQANRTETWTSELLRTEVAMKAGKVPDGDFPDSDVRLLGSALTPLSKSYPKAGPLLMLALSFGLVSGILMLAAMSGRRRRSGAAALPERPSKDRDDGPRSIPLRPASSSSHLHPLREMTWHHRPGNVR